MTLEALLKTVTYCPHHEPMAAYEALTESQRIPLRVEVQKAIEREGDADNEFAADMRKLRVAIAGPGAVNA
jgi:hypothetical protein